MSWQQNVLLALGLSFVGATAGAVPIAQIGSDDVATGAVTIGFESLRDGNDWREDTVTIGGVTFTGGSVFTGGVSAPMSLAITGNNSYFDTQIGPVTVAFDDPVYQLGTWYLVRPGVGDLTMEVRDETGAVLGFVSGALPDDAGTGMYGYPTGFLGVSSPTPIGSALIYVPGGPETRQFTIDEFMYVPSTPPDIPDPASPLPEPTTALIVGSGVLSLILSRKRSQRKAMTSRPRRLKPRERTDVN